METLKIEKVKDRIWLDPGPYDPSRVDAFKSVHGARWNPEYKVWTYPLDMSVCRSIRGRVAERLGLKLEIGPDLTDWAWAAIRHEETIPDVNSLEAVELPRLESASLKLHDALQSRGFQTVGAGFAALNRRCLIADDPGLGKTIQTLGAVGESGLTGMMLVIAPKTAAAVTWPAEIERWLPGDQYVIIGSHLNAIKRAQAIHDARTYCMNNPNERMWVISSPYYTRMQPKLDSRGNYIYDKGVKLAKYNLIEMHETTWSAIVVDESHQTLACDTNNKKKQSQQRLGLGALSTVDNGLKIALSGTPFRGKPENLFGTLNWLRPDLYTSYWRWVEEHFDMYEETGPFGSVVIGGIRDEEAFYKEAASVMIRRTKKEVVSELPSKLYGGEPLDLNDPDSVVGVWLKMTSKQKKVYKQMVDEAAAELEDGVLMANGVLSEMTRLKQFASASARVDEDGEYVPCMPSNKFDWIIDFLDDRGITGSDTSSGGDTKVIIASQFTRLIKLFKEELDKIGIDSHMLVGGTSDKNRQKMQNEFQSEGGPRVFLLNTKAGGVSLTLDAADDIVIVDETSIPDDQLQVEDRAHRVSRTDHQVTIWYLRTLGTIEETIGGTSAERERAYKSIIDGQRGVDFAKKILGS